MRRVREVIVVEGRYDKNALKQVVDAAVVETGGFGVFKDREKLALLRRLAAERGLILLTDSAGAGFVVAFAGSIIAMPGLPKAPAALKIDVDDNGQIVGLF